MTTLTVMPASAQDLKSRDFERWLENTDTEWFLEYLKPSPEARARHLMGRFSDAVNGPVGRVFLCLEEDRLLAAMALKRLGWDSDHFKIEYAQIAPCCTAPGLSADRLKALHTELLKEARQWAEANGIRLLQRRLRSARVEEIRCLEDAGFRLADNIVTLWRSLVGAFPVGNADQRLACRPAQKSDLPALVAMTGGAFPHSRFVTDPHLDPVKGGEVYMRWIENVLTGGESPKSAGHVRVCTLGKEVVGYGTYRTDLKLDKQLGRRLGTLDLLVVSASHRGRGVGRYLLGDLLEAMRKDGISDVEATTWIKELASQALYKNAGMQVSDKRCTYHLWLS